MHTTVTATAQVDLHGCICAEDIDPGMGVPKKVPPLGMVRNVDKKQDYIIEDSKRILRRESPKVILRDDSNRPAGPHSPRQVHASRRSLAVKEVSILGLNSKVSFAMSSVLLIIII